MSNHLENLDEILRNNDYTWKNVLDINRSVRFLRDANLNGSQFVDFELENEKFGAWDDSLSNYCKEVIQHKCKHIDTKHYRYYEDLRLIGKICFSEISFNKLSTYSDIINKEYSLLNNFNFYEYQIIKNQRVICDSDGYIFSYLKSKLSTSDLLNMHRLRPLNLMRKYTRTKIFNRLDKVIRIANSISKYGWIPEQCGDNHNIILARSRTNRKISVLTGRHRIAALRYLLKEDLIPPPMIRCLMFDHSGENFMWNTNFK